MGTTPDRYPGTREEDELKLSDGTSDGDPTEEGVIKRIGDKLKFRDSVGVKQIQKISDNNDVKEIDFSGITNGQFLSYNSSTEKMEAVDGSGLPPATQIGQILYSLNGSTFTVELPLTTKNGWLINDDGEHIVVG